MAKFPLTPTHQSFGQGSNLHSLSPMRDFAVGHFSPPKTKQEIPYQHLRSVHPITCKFTKFVGLIPRIQHLPYTSRKPKTTPTRVVVSSLEEVVLATLEGLAKAIEDGEEPSFFWQGERDTLVVLGSDFGTGGRGEGSGGGEGRDEPTDSEPEPSDSEEEG